MENDLFENLRLELRRGSLILAVLAQLRTEQYGYVLRKSLSDHGLQIDENTLYPLLRRLETQGLLASVWREEDKRNKRFYRLTPDGETLLTRLLAEHEAMNAALDRILRPAANGSAALAPEPSSDQQDSPEKEKANAIQ